MVNTDGSTTEKPKKKPATKRKSSKPKKVAGSAYERKRVAEAARSAAKSKSGRDIGPIPNIANVERRESCRTSLRLFCETYNRDAFGLHWSDDHLRMIARLEEAVTLGALFAFAMPRGSGKTTLVRMAALWALSYSLSNYVFVIGANAAKAEDTLEAIKTYCRFLTDFAADFPEITYPVNALEGIPHRAGGQTSQGNSTLIEWAKDCVRFPTVLPPKNWPKEWPLRSDGMVPTSGRVFAASGLTGDGIRGSLKTLSTGQSIRPDLVLIDDPQSSESAHSVTQNATRERLISADVLGMAGPGRKISAVMPCTVIAKNDMIDRLLDRSLHPMWRGERTKMLRTFPAQLDAWESYFEVYRQCAMREPPDFTDANAYYIAHRSALDAGAEASWAARKLPDEVSAIQHAMNLYCRDPKAFFSEYQNDPQDTEGSKSSEITPADVTKKLNRVNRLMVPRECTRLTSFIDVGGKVLWYAVCAWDERFGGAVVDYGTFPRQNRSYFAASDVRPSIQDVFPGMSEEAAIYKALETLTETILNRDYIQAEIESPVRINRCLIDSGWNTDTVYQFCRQSAHSSIVQPSKGYAVTAAGKPMAEWPKRPGERAGWNWRVGVPSSSSGRLCTFDPNQWKTFTAERILTPHGAAGCLSIFGNEPYVHQLFADHLSSEYCTETTGRGRTVQVWQVRPDRVDNHWFDCIVGCAVAASEQGLVWNASDKPTQQSGPRKKRNLAELYAQQRGQSNG